LNREAINIPDIKRNSLDLRKNVKVKHIAAHIHYFVNTDKLWIKIKDWISPTAK
jgi:hypothetical protein